MATNLLSNATVSYTDAGYGGPTTAIQTLVDGITDSSMGYIYPMNYVGQALFTFATPVSISAIAVWTPYSATVTVSINGGTATSQAIITGTPILVTQDATVSTILVTFTSPITEMFVYPSTGTAFSFAADTSRRIAGELTTFTTSSDTSRVIATVIMDTINLWGLSSVRTNYYLESISISIDSGQLTERYEADMRGNVTINQYFQCLVGDFLCSFRILDVSQNPIGSAKVTARLDLDDWIYRKMVLNYTAGSSRVISNSMNVGTQQTTTMPMASTVLDSLGISGVFTDFVATNIGLQSGKRLNSSGLVVAADNIWGLLEMKTKKEVLLSLFSWSSSFPRLKHLIAIRNGVPYVYQRNLLSTVSNLDDLSKWTTNLKNSHKEILRTLKGTPIYGYETTITNLVNTDDSDAYIQPLEGSVEFNGTVIEYSNGLITSETYPNGDVITYSYEQITGIISTSPLPKMLLVKKTTPTNMIEYDYDTFKGESYLASCIDSKMTDGSYVPTQQILYTPLGNNMWGSTTYKNSATDGTTDWVYSSSSTHEGPSGGQASIASAKKLASRNGSENTTTTTVTVKGYPCSDIPDAPDYDTSALISSELSWMDGKTHETIDLDVYNLVNNNHVIDVIEKVTYLSSEWHVVSNKITINPLKVGQSLTLERWY